MDFSKKIQDIIRYLEIGDADMEKGQMRLEANISIRTEEMEKKGIIPEYKVEIKNINSFRFMEKAVRAEIQRQKDLWDKGTMPVQENRGYDEHTGVTVSQREKEEAHDYRYFPEPDIPPMNFDNQYIENLKKSLPELPSRRKQRLIQEFGLNDNSAKFLTSAPNKYLFDKFMELVKQGNEPSKIANLLMNKKELWDMSVENIGKKLKESDGVNIDENTVMVLVQKVIYDNPDILNKIKTGKDSTVEYVVGQVMRETRGNADPVLIRKVIKELTSM